MSVGAEENSSPHRYMCAARVREEHSLCERARLGQSLWKSASQSERVLSNESESHGAIPIRVSVNK